MTRRVVRTKTERTLALVARRKAWSGSLTAASLVTPPIRGDPVGENGYSPRLPLVMRLRCKGRGDMMTTRQRSAKLVGKTARERQRLPAELSQLNQNAGGIDVGASSHFVAVPADRAEPPVREFAGFTADLYRLADWLAECGVETVVMESTGVYWIPLFGVLEERGFQVMLVDPRRIKNVSGRKTDVRDCQWLRQQHTYGLLSGAFRPEAEIRRLRSYLRQRAMLVQYASHHIQHMQKALTQMNVKLQHVISDITGKTGMDIMEAIVGGERDPRKLARLRDARIKADEATIAGRCGGTGARSTSSS